MLYEFITILTRVIQTSTLDHLNIADLSEPCWPVGNYNKGVKELFLYVMQKNFSWLFLSTADCVALLWFTAQICYCISV